MKVGTTIARIRIITMMRTNAFFIQSSSENQSIVPKLSKGRMINLAIPMTFDLSM